MNNVQLHKSLKNILQGLSDEACFALIATALNAKEFDFLQKLNKYVYDYWVKPSIRMILCLRFYTI